MKVHEMNLQPKYFDFIKDGTKRIELRLYDEKRQSIQLGDIIEFAKSDNEKFKAERWLASCDISLLLIYLKISISLFSRIVL